MIVRASSPRPAAAPDLPRPATAVKAPAPPHRAAGSAPTLHSLLRGASTAAAAAAAGRPDPSAGSHPVSRDGEAHAAPAPPFAASPPATTAGADPSDSLAAPHAPPNGSAAFALHVLPLTSLPAADAGPRVGSGFPAYPPAAALPPGAITLPFAPSCASMASVASLGGGSGCGLGGGGAGELVTITRREYELLLLKDRCMDVLQVCMGAHWHGARVCSSRPVRVSKRGGTKARAQRRPRRAQPRSRRGPSGTHGPPARLLFS
jgi:hypothetical protein